VVNVHVKVKVKFVPVHDMKLYEGVVV